MNIVNWAITLCIFMNLEIEVPTTVLYINMHTDINDCDKLPFFVDEIYSNERTQ